MFGELKKRLTKEEDSRAGGLIELEGRKSSFGGASEYVTKNAVDLGIEDSIAHTEEDCDRNQNLELVDRVHGKKHTEASKMAHAPKNQNWESPNIVRRLANHHRSDSVRNTEYPHKILKEGRGGREQEVRNARCLRMWDGGGCTSFMERSRTSGE